ncbi:SepM family pheromone-processing serine protease [Paenibacillus naphthalenovorans]|uniref:endopeptidase La n=1 Tax=Paenibacillus naphthalenovorans TaxID=162209 RepID=A0A0U2M2N1_9BACL|nr:SepM family pheromone-processing serine protease [Paenibacillus naphthalenovorans]ALS21584.1 PDZ/DHR/GLGF domain-containing protein [Paenibacillus naphthalenovorans]
MKRASRIVFSVFTAIALLYLIYFMPLPLYIFKPGTADVIQPMVQVEQAASEEEKGQFMLTTVAVSDATVYGYLMSFISPYQELRLKEDLLRKGESESEYTQRQAVVMMTSQADAIQAVYNKLNIPYRISHDGVVVEHIYPDYPAHEILRAGDYIVKVDDKLITTADELRASLANKKAGDTAAISYKRGNVIRTGNIALAVLPSEDATAPAGAHRQRAGLGIVPAEVHSVKAEDESKQVSIKAGNIGGPSAGLMFALEIYNRFVPEDITKGYKIAGTGEIDPEGNVGVIGGIQHKVVAADRAGADIFFSPKDYRTPDGRTIPNYTDAKKRAEEIGTDMTVVPVGTLDEALQYLAGLPVKPSS